MSKTVKCPECGYTYKPIGEETVWCSGKREDTTVSHKKLRKMK